MSSGGLRLGVGLLALLTWLGPVSSAEAGLAFNRGAFEPAWPWSAGADGMLAQARQSPDASKSSGAPTEGQSPAPIPPPGPFPATQPGTSAPSGGPTGGGATLGSSCLPPPSAWRLAAEAVGQLFLADERLKPPPFASRLFRPPR
jgi:hypothetical protein